MNNLYASLPTSETTVVKKVTIVRNQKKNKSEIHMKFIQIKNTDVIFPYLDFKRT